MKIINRAMVQAYEDEKKMLEKRHEEALAELETRKPQPIELRRHSENGSPKKLAGNVVAPPGMLYGKDHNGQPIVMHPDEITHGQHWDEVK